MAAMTAGDERADLVCWDLGGVAQLRMDGWMGPQLAKAEEHCI